MKRPLMVAGTVLVVDLLSKEMLVTPDWAQHYREPRWQVEALVASLLAFVVVVWNPWSIGAAFLLGGVSANLISSLSGPIANPFVVHLVAFNAADVALFFGAIVFVLEAPLMAHRFMSRVMSRG